MDTTRYSEFNSNNYLPSAEADMATANFPVIPGLSQVRGPGPQGSFTFTTPTQCSTLGTPRPCIETMSPINLSAPGVGAFWQHSIPTTMPWVDVSSSAQNTPVGTATIFTGMPFNVFTGPHPSTSELPRRTKRKAVDTPTEVPLSKVHLCADQLANMRITPHQQQTLVPSRSEPQSGEELTSALWSASKSEQWERFRELESRLSANFDEKLNASSTENGKAAGVMRLNVASGVLEKSSMSPILPRKVMEDINKPCMQLVLWQSPEKLIRDISNEDSKTGSSLTASDRSDSTTDSTTSSSSSSSSLKGNASSTSEFPTYISAADNLLCGPSYFSTHRSPLSFSSQSVFNRQQNGTACSLSPSPDFLRPLSSSNNNSRTLFSSSSPALNILQGSGNSLSVMSPYNSNNHHFVNQSSSIFNTNNNNNNDVMDMFDSVDDEMQL